MSESQCSELVSHFFTVSADAFALNDKRIDVHVNTKSPDIIQLTVGGVRITTDRANWTAIFRAFADVVCNEVVEITLPGHTIRVDLNDKTAVLS